MSNISAVEMSERVRGKGVGFDRIRRITGYLVGTLDRFNNGKAAEEHDRVKHSASAMDEIEAQAEAVRVETLEFAYSH